MGERFSPEMEKLRKQAADVVREGRSADRQKGDAGFEMTRNRGIGLYVRGLGGLEHFLDYASSLSEQGDKAKLLDIGAGNTRALGELSAIKDWSSNLDLLATSITSSKQVDKFLGKEKLRLTSAENLRGIKDHEIAAILSVHGIGWTKAPKLTAESINRVLKPSGILKAIFAYNPGDRSDTRERNQKFLINHLKHLKYDTYVSVESIENVLNIPGQKLKNTRLLAIKSPIKKGFSAKDLAKADFEDMGEQLDFLAQKGY